MRIHLGTVYFYPLPAVVAGLAGVYLPIDPYSEDEDENVYGLRAFDGLASRQSVGPVGVVLPTEVHPHQPQHNEMRRMKYT